MDIDTFVARHAAEWARLEALARRAGRPRRLSGAEVDELVELYQRVATHLSVVQAELPDPVLVARLSQLVARARSAVAGRSALSLDDLVRFVQVDFPAAVYRGRRWIVAAGLASIAVAWALGWWVAAHPAVQAQLLPPEKVRQLVDRDFASYYSTYPGASFAAQVWTNNVWVSVIALVLGIALGLPTIYALWGNAVNVGISGGFMAAAGHTGEFFGLILPHGMLELTAVFIAAGVGLRLGWTLVDPGPRRRAETLAQEGRSAVTVALGLVAVLAVSGAIEAFVTPSGLPTWARVGIGVVVWGAFVAYVVRFGRAAVAAGETGDVDPSLRSATVPVAA